MLTEEPIPEQPEPLINKEKSERNKKLNEDFEKSTKALLNWIIASLVILTLAFAWIPYLKR